MIYSDALADIHQEVIVTTQETLERYFAAIHTGGWEAFVAEEFTFINNSLDRVAHGKAAYLDGAGRFFRSSTSVDLRQVLIDGDRAAVLARYHLRSPQGSTGACDVAEFLTFADGMLTSSAIFFDARALTEFMAR